MSVEETLTLLGQVGLAVTLVIVLWYVILIPRKTPDGKRKASLLVPGWIHDDAVAEVERVRLFYEAALRDAQTLADSRIQEWRGFRDEEVVRRKDAEADRKALLEAVKGLNDDIQSLIEMQKLGQVARAHENEGAVTRFSGKKKK